VSTYVLVHGAWHGGWCWRKVKLLLRQAGHEVFTPTLTGLGERSHLLSPSVDLTTHVQDVVSAIEYEDLHDVILVSHSYSGMVTTGVAAIATERIAHLVYLDATVPLDGESLFDTEHPDVRKELEDLAEMNGDGWRVPPFPASSLGVSSEDDVQWLTSQMGDHPLATFSQPLRYDESLIQSIPRTFIQCTVDGLSPPLIIERVQADSSWNYLEIETGHDAMVTEPEALTEILVEIV